MNTQSTQFEPAEQSTIGALIPHLPRIMLERKWLIIIPAVIGLAIGVAFAFLLPVTYQSRAVLIVEAPLLPEEIAQDARSAEIIDQRMARIRQELFSRTQLIDLINRNGLYLNELRVKTFSEVIDEMRDAINIESVTPNIQTGGSNAQSTIAFSITYDYSDPVKAQAVLQSLTQQIQQINSSTQSAQATSMVQFLTDQTSDLQQQIASLENMILQIKSNNSAALSGVNSGYFTSPEAIEAQIMSLEQTVSALKAQRELVSSSSDRDPGVQQAETDLAALRAKYAETHPDVVLAKQRLAQAKRLAENRESEFPVNRLEQIDQQIALNNRQIASLRGAMGSAASSAAAARQAPVVQEQLAQLQERLSGLNEQYQRAAIQLRAAQAGKRADEEQQGERLRQLEAPTIPEEPISPNRPLLIAAGLGGGLGFGLALVLLLEMFSRPIRHVSTVTHTLGEPPLVVIPTIFAPGERGPGLLSRFWPGGKDDDEDDEDDEDGK